MREEVSQQDLGGGQISTIHYDSQFRVTSLVDATGRSTTFTYAVPGRKYLISKITDPFGRASQLAYDGSGRLISITDAVGTSNFNDLLIGPSSGTGSMVGGSGAERFVLTGAFEYITSGSGASILDLSVGGIHFAHVPVAINGAEMSSSLLGMAFLKRLKSYSFSEGKLILRW